jgi:hypothetical protein
MMECKRKDPQGRRECGASQKLERGQGSQSTELGVGGKRQNCLIQLEASHFKDLVLCNGDP